MTRLSGVASVIAVTLAITACGGSSRSNAYSAYNRGQQRSMLGGGAPQNASAGTVANYQSSGQLIADNGFRPATNGFSFQNYGNDAGPQNLTPAQVADIFGDQVCASGSGSSCQLTPPAQVWMDNQNKAMAGGHCMGFSVAALRFYSGNQALSDFGSVGQASQLQIQGDDQLQETIAEDWTFQNLPLVRQAVIQAAPTDIANKLIGALKDKREYYTLVILKRDGTGGHAITPYAVEDLGNGKDGILVYDNNFPGVTRVLTVDTTANTWSYDGGPNPNDLSEHYDGDAQTQNLLLFPTTPGEQQQPCPFCNGQNAANSGSSNGSVGTTLSPAQQYNEITLNGNPANHAHLVLTDDQGRQTGFINGTEVKDIPGVTVDYNIANQDWSESPEPSYLVPVTDNVTVTIDGSDLKSPDTEELNLVGPGLYTLVKQIKLDPGQKDEIKFNTDGLGYVFKTDAHQAESPVLGAGVQGKQADYGFGVRAFDVSGGSSVALRLDRANEQLEIDTAGTAGAGDYLLSVYRENARGTASWTTTHEAIRLEGGQVAHVDYGNTRPGSPMRLDIRNADGTLGTTIHIAQDKSS